MDTNALFTIFLTNLLLILTPGPFLALMLSRCARGGVMAGLRVMAGNLLVTVLLLGLALGVAQAAEMHGRLEAMLGWIGSPVLFWLAWRTLSAGPADPGQDRGKHDVLEGMLIAGSSPTMLLFYVALLPRFLPVGPMEPLAVLMIAGVILLGEILCGIVMILLGLRAMALGRRARRGIEIGAAACLGVSAASAAIAAFFG